MVELTRHRRGRGQQFVMLSSVQERLGLSDKNLDAAVAFGVKSGALEVAHGSIAVHKQPLKRRGGPRSSLTSNRPPCFRFSQWARYQSRALRYTTTSGRIRAS